MNVTLGVRTHMGWLAYTALAKRGKKLLVVRTGRLETGDSRDSIEPYHVAGGFDGLDRVPRPGNPDSVVATGLAAQERTTRKHLKTLVGELTSKGFTVKKGAILTGRGKLAASLDKILASHAQIHVAEGLAVRRSVERALSHLDIGVAKVDEKSIEQLALDKLGVPVQEAFAALGVVRADDVEKWTKEEKVCALAAWLSA